MMTINMNGAPQLAGEVSAPEQVGSAVGAVALAGDNLSAIERVAGAIADVAVKIPFVSTLLSPYPPRAEAAVVKASSARRGYVHGVTQQALDSWVSVTHRT